MPTKVKDKYQVLASKAEGIYKEKGSKFLAFAFPVCSLDEIELALQEIKGKHPKSRHYCYAYRLGIDGKEYRLNDDGEPSGTAGKPIYGQLLSFDVSDVFVVVVRYFGGTKLGASGLINAYKTSTFDALKNAKFDIKTLSDDYNLIFDYAEMGHVMNVIKSQNLSIVKKDFGAIPKVRIQIPLGEIDRTLIELKAALLNITTDNINEKTEISFCSIEKIEET